MKITHTYSYTDYGDCKAATAASKSFNGMKTFFTLCLIGGFIGCCVWADNISWGIAEGAKWADITNLIAPYALSVLVALLIALFERAKHRNVSRCNELYVDYLEKLPGNVVVTDKAIIDKNALIAKRKQVAADEKDAGRVAFLFFLFAALAVFSVVYMIMAGKYNYWSFIYIIVTVVTVLPSVLFGLVLSAGF